MELVIERATIADVTEIAKIFDAYRVFYKQRPIWRSQQNF